LLTWPAEFSPDEDFAVVREASMLDDMNAVFGCYLDLQRLASQPSVVPHTTGHHAVCDGLAALAQALPAGVSSRVEGVRAALTQLASHLRLLFRCHDRAEIADTTIDSMSDLIANLSLRIVGARQRLQLTPLSNIESLEIEFRSIGRSMATARTTRDQAAAISLALEIDERVDMSVDLAQRLLPPGLAAVMQRLLNFLSELPSKQDGILLVPSTAEPGAHTALPGWIPLSRRLGGFTVIRPIGSGAGGSVLLAVRSDLIKRSADQTVALKVPDYDGGAARSMSEQEFETVFREEASALLSLPRHKNLAGFVTFDASAVPKPILVMEFVPGPNLEHVIDGRRLHMKRALNILDGILAGLSLMHASGLAHLDVKPPNVVLRSGQDEPVLVDFGLAGRRLRIGCGSPHYAAREVWLEPDASNPVMSPFPADIYAVGCIAAELFTGKILVTGDTLSDVVGIHLAGTAGNDVCQRLAKNGLADIASLLASAFERDAAKRPTATAFRQGLAAMAPQLATRSWPLLA
jgi:eukaryotic-like serine/threonine-protein kinase